MPPGNLVADTPLGQTRPVVLDLTDHSGRSLPTGVPETPGRLGRVSSGLGRSAEPGSSNNGRRLGSRGLVPSSDTKGPRKELAEPVCSERIGPTGERPVGREQSSIRRLKPIT